MRLDWPLETTARTIMADVAAERILTRNRDCWLRSKPRVVHKPSVIEPVYKTIREIV